MPESGKEKYWINDDIMIRAGYSMIDIENMESDEYDFKLALCLGTPKQKNNLQEGL